jgi:hypothetical protein
VTYQELVEQYAKSTWYETRIADIWAAANNSTATQGIAITGSIKSAANPWGLGAAANTSAATSVTGVSIPGYTRFGGAQIVCPPGFHLVIDAMGAVSLEADEPPPPAVVTEAPGPRRPAPALPVEAHRTAEFDSAQAWNATLAACRGQR